MREGYTSLWSQVPCAGGGTPVTDPRCLLGEGDGAMEATEMGSER